MTFTTKENKTKGLEAYGNFRDYYSFNPAWERVGPLLASRALHTFLVSSAAEARGVAVVDVGCNAGDVAVELYDGMREKMEEIARGRVGESEGLARERIDGERLEAMGLKRKRSEDESEGKEIEKESTCKDTSSPPQSANVPRLSILGIDLDGGLIERANAKLAASPHRRDITFVSGNVMEPAGREAVAQFLCDRRPSATLFLCLSVTMWVHLHHADAGLSAFLAWCTHEADSLVIEPQPWKCYKTARKRTRRGHGEYVSLDGLRHREDVEAFIHNTIEESGGALVEQVCLTKWKRRLCWYTVQEEERALKCLGTKEDDKADKEG